MKTKLLATLGAALGLGALSAGCVHSPGDSAIIYAENSSSQLENGAAREENIFCYNDGSLELQLKYKDAEGRTRIFVSLERKDGLYCNESISIVDPTGIALDSESRVPEVSIMYDDGCNLTMDRFSRRPAGNLEQNAMHYRSLWSDEDIAANDEEYGLLRSQIDDIFGIEAQVQACMDRN